MKGTRVAVLIAALALALAGIQLLAGPAGDAAPVDLVPELGIFGSFNPRLAPFTNE
jgi:hypothetical protein